MKTVFILSERITIEIKSIAIKVEEFNASTYIIEAPTTDIADLIEVQIKKQSKEYIKIITGGVLFAPCIVEGSSNKAIYFEFDGNKLTTYDEKGENQRLKNEDTIIQVLSRIEHTEVKIFFRSKVLKNVESILKYMYGENIKFTHIPNEDAFEITSKSKHELSAIRRILVGSNIEYIEVHYGSAFNIPSVYVHDMQRVIYFTLDDNGQYIPLYTKVESDEVIHENVEFLKNFMI